MVHMVIVVRMTIIIIRNGFVHYWHILALRENTSYCIKREKNLLHLS